MALVHDEDDALVANALEVSLREAAVVIVDVAHLLDGGHYERVGVIVTLELRPEHVCVFGRLHAHRVIREVAVLVERLRAQLDSVHEEDHLVSVVRVGDELGTLEARHRLSRAGGVPHVASPCAFLVPPRLPHPVGDGRGSVVLVAAHDLERSILVVGNRVEAYELVGHGDGEQVSHHVVPVINGLVVEVCPVEAVEREVPRGAGVGEVDSLCGLHSHEYLHEREQS